MLLNQTPQMHSEEGQHYLSSRFTAVMDVQDQTI